MLWSKNRKVFVKRSVKNNFPWELPIRQENHFFFEQTNCFHLKSGEVTHGCFPKKNGRLTPKNPKRKKGPTLFQEVDQRLFCFFFWKVAFLFAKKMDFGNSSGSSRLKSSSKLHTNQLSNQTSISSFIPGLAPTGTWTLKMQWRWLELPGPWN